jgi:hypothetical protein
MPRLEKKSGITKRTKGKTKTNEPIAVNINPEPELCCICYEEFISSRKETVLHEIKTSERTVIHKCHEECTNQWIKRCIINKATPFCPICPSVNIKYNKEVLNVTKQIIRPSRYEAAALARFEGLRVDCPALFGIMVCINKSYVIRYMNYDMMLNETSRLTHIKRFILSKKDEIYESTRAYLPSKFWFNMNYKNWMAWKYPNIKIADVHFAIPPFCKKIGLLGEEALDDDSTLGEMYIRYQTLAGEMYYNHDFEPNVNQSLSDVYMEKLVRKDWSTGPDDPGVEYCAFVNPENPPNLNAYGINRGTYNSVSWIAVHLEYDE